MPGCPIKKAGPIFEIRKSDQIALKRRVSIREILHSQGIQIDVLKIIKERKKTEFDPSPPFSLNQELLLPFLFLCNFNTISFVFMFSIYNPTEVNRKNKNTPVIRLPLPIYRLIDVQWRETCHSFFPLKLYMFFYSELIVSFLFPSPSD